MFRFRAKAWLGRVCGITPGQSLRNRSRISQLALLCQPRFQRCLCFVCCLQKLCAACSVKGGNWGVPFMDFRFSSSGNPNSRSEALKRSRLTAQAAPAAGAATGRAWLQDGAGTGDAARKGPPKASKDQTHRERPVPLLRRACALLPPLLHIAFIESPGAAFTC